MLRLTRVVLTRDVLRPLFYDTVAPELEIRVSTVRVSPNLRAELTVTPSSSGNNPKEAAARVQAYLAALPPDSRRVLKKMRDAIRSAAPSATESFSYGIPGFKLDGKSLIWYAAWKNHTSLYPLTAIIKRTLGAELEGHEMAKGTIRFPLSNPPSPALVKRIVNARIAELRKDGKA